MNEKIMNIIKNKKIMLISGITILVCIILLSLFFIQKNKLNNVSETLSSMEENIIREGNLISNELIADLTNEIEEELAEEQPQENSNNSNSQNSNKLSSSTNYYIKVNYQANVVTIYQKDADGDFHPIKAMICSTGSATPRSGVYSVKTKWVWGKLFGNVYGHYVTKIVGNILFHSVPYTAASPDSLEYWEYDKLGTSVSMGCVRLRVIDSKWIFDNMPSGTPVEFYASSDPGPLGKPGSQQISSNTDCRDWDPTDPDPGNPWRTYVAPTPSVPTPVPQQPTPANTETNKQQTDTNQNTSNSSNTQNNENNQSETNTNSNTSASNSQSDENMTNSSNVTNTTNSSSSEEIQSNTL